MFRLSDDMGNGSGMTSTRTSSFPRRILAASAVAVLSLGAVACDDDDDDNIEIDDPTDDVEEGVEDVGEDVEDVTNTIAGEIESETTDG